MRTYAGRVSDLERQIHAVREETSQLRQQIPIVADLQEDVSNLAARLLTLELAQKQWEDGTAADWYDQQQDNTLEQGLEQVTGDNTAQFTMSERGIHSPGGQFGKYRRQAQPDITLSRPATFGRE